MTTLMTALNGATTLTTNTAPTQGSINSYNASSGALAVTLPALSGLNVGSWCIVEKNVADGTFNAVTFTRNGSDAFDDGSTSVALYAPGHKITLEVVTISGTTYWKVVNTAYPRSGLFANASVFTLSNTTSPGTICTFNINPYEIAAGSSYRIVMDGTIACLTSGSGTLTFEPFFQGTGMTGWECSMASQTTAGPTPFHLEYTFTVRTAASSGTVVAKPWGIINLSTPVYLTSTGTTATTVNTTETASSFAISVTATWQTASVSNVLRVETATIERVV
jgi:hypothetical protein